MKFIEFIKKQSIGFYIGVATLGLAIVGLCLYFTVDPGFSGFLKSKNLPSIVGFTVTAMVLVAAQLIVFQFDFIKNIDSRIRFFATMTINIIIVAFFAVAVINVISSGIYELGLALGSALGDKTTANKFIVAIVFEVISLVAAMSGAFFCIVRENRSEVAETSDNTVA